MLEREPQLENLGIYVFTYQTNLFSGSYNLSDVVDSLKEHMQLDGVVDCRKLFFVCHSMGGIIVRKFLVERAADLIEKKVMIGLFLVSSPSLGASYANWLAPLSKFLGHAQADALRFAQDNVWLNGLDKEFQNLRQAGKLMIFGKELVEDKFIVLSQFLRRQVVEPFAGARYFGEPYKVPGSDHFSIAKPENTKAIQHRLLCQFIISTLQQSQSDAEDKGSQANAPTSARSKGGAQDPLIKFKIALFSAKDSPEAEPWDEIHPGVFQRNFELAADPVFDISVANRSGMTLTLFRIGIRILHRTPATGGIMGRPTEVEVQAELRVHCHQEWKRFDLSNNRCWRRLPNPIAMEKDDSPYRFTFLLENFCDIDSASKSELRFCVDTNEGIVESESIWLWQ